MNLSRHETMPQIRSVMTPFPYFVDPAEPVSQVRRLLLHHGIRHLPVVSEGRPLGVVTERDIESALYGMETGRDPEALAVGELGVPPAYVVGMGERLDRVLSEMARRHVDAALVVRDEKLAGIFTTTDACRHFAETLEELFPESGGDAA